MTSTPVPNPYDVVPYECRAVPLTHPDRLCLAALAQGLRPAPVARARVLELGCGNATNLLGMAFHLDAARFVGVERSPVQHAAGVAARDRLGVTNLELRCADLLELGDDLGEFDYVIAHGVFSWVPPRVREGILAICARHLAPQGVAYVSYNTFPGWSVRGQVREAMRLLARDAADPREQIARGRQALALLAAANQGAETGYSALLGSEVAQAQQCRDAYLLHEYLSPDNQAFQFGEFVGLAAAHGLAYLDELSHALVDARAEGTLRARMRELVPDPAAADQLADQVVYRQFRATLLRRAETTPATPEARDALLERCLLAGALKPEAKRPSLDADAHEVFLGARDTRITSADPWLKAALLELRRVWPRALSFPDLCACAAAHLALRGVRADDAPPPEAERASLASDLQALHALGHLQLRTWQPPIAYQPGARPRVSPLTRLEAERGSSVTNMLHTPVELDAFSRVLVRQLDGVRDTDALVERMAAAFAQGDLDARQDDGPPPTPDDVRALLPTLIANSVAQLAESALLVEHG